jgi:hypothetical protein
VIERDAAVVLGRIRALVAAGAYRIAQHARGEMVEESIAMADVVQALMNGAVIEDYPDHRRGPCCLVAGRDDAGRGFVER